MEPEKLHCPSCQILIVKEYNFCPNCGKKFHEPPQSTGIGRQIVVYLISIFLPPLGFWPGIKYIRQKEQKAQLIGIVAISLTVLSTALSLWLTVGMLDEYTKMLDSQMQTYRQMGL
jgi:hypothetical protein